MRNENGRSLIEIIGILAIIGILSIGGIVGYKIAVYRYQASQLIDINNKYAFLLFEQCRSIYDRHQTSLASIENCTKNTPGIPTFEKAGIGQMPYFIPNKSIDFRGITFDESTKKYIINTRIQFSSKEHCLAIKYIKNIKNGCRESVAPFNLILQTTEN